MDKSEFKKNIKEFMERNKVQAAKDITDPANSVIVVTAVEDFDPKTNDMWDMEANKSYPRDIACGECHRKVVMSGGMLSMYEKAEPKPEVKCAVCLLASLEKEK